MQTNKRVTAQTGGWYDLASQRLAVRMPSDMFVGFGEGKMIPLTTMPFEGIRNRYGVVSSRGNHPITSSQLAAQYDMQLRAPTSVEHHGFTAFVVPLQVRASDLESDSALLRCIASIENVVAFHREIHPTFRGVVNIFPRSQSRSDMFGLETTHYNMKRLIDLCRTLADLGIIAAFVPRHPDEFMNHREAEQMFLDQILTKILYSAADLRIMVHQVRTMSGVEWIVQHAYDGSSDGQPRVIASLSPADMIEPFDMSSPDLSDYDRWQCFDAEALRYHAFAYPGLFCLGSGSVVHPPEVVASEQYGMFRSPVLMQMLLEQAFDIFRLPPLPTATSSIGEADRNRVEESCASRIASFDRFAAITGPAFYGLSEEGAGLPAETPKSLLAFEPTATTVPHHYKIDPDQGDLSHNVVVPWRAGKQLVWKYLFPTTSGPA